MIFKQVRSIDGTGTLSYIIADEGTRRGIVIDPNIEDLAAIKRFLTESRVDLEYIIDTHTHVDHISAAGELRRAYDSKFLMHENTRNKWKVVDEGDKFGIGDILRANAALEVDEYVKDNDELVLDSLNIKFLFTPGHTDNHLSILLNNMIFTGDLLLIGQAGRSDLPGGSPEDQYDSLFSKVLTLPGHIKIYPGHDYDENEFALLSTERTNNPFLENRTKEEYVQFVKDFFPPISEFTESGKATLQCGTKRVVNEEKAGFRNINPFELYEMMTGDEDIFLLDVREPFELIAFGAVPGVINIPMGMVISKIGELPKDKRIVVICQSGNRSYEVAHYLSVNGFNKVYNLEDGTISWLYSKASAKYSKAI
jgi:glyoxylase-like metal-dependent hydrolase (beta-lactamase superfamily II)/rhodanese-related sulfurtransferase